MLSYEDIVENLNEGVVVADIDLTIKVFNQSMEKMTGLARSVVIGKPARDVFKRDERIVEMLEKTLKEGKLYAEYEEKLHRRFAPPFPAGITTSQIFDIDGRLTGVAALVKDLSGVKSLEVGSLRKERLVYIGTFAASLAHEIRNPLSGMRGAAQLLAKKAKGAGFDEYTGIIMKEADRLNVILKEVLDFAGPARLIKKEINIHRVLDNVALLLQDDASEVAIIKEYDPSLPSVVADENQITQVFLNLVKNARESIAKKGSVHIITRMITDFHIVGEYRAGVAGGKMASVEIRDTGCGIASADIEKIFTPFYTTKAKGSGLGMAISLKIIEEHGALLRIDSEQGKGTSVKVLLPVCVEEGRIRHGE